MSENPSNISRSICRDVQSLLYDYMGHELGPARSEFVREHVRRCETCRAELVSIQKAFDILNVARKAPVPAHLSVSHRRRMARAVMHPVLDWICRHNVLVATVAMLLTILLAVILMRWAMDVEKPDDSDAVPVFLVPHTNAGEGPDQSTQPPSLQEGAK